MILRNFRGLDAKCLHPKPSLRKIREADGDNLGLRILREEVACYYDSEEARKHKGTPGKGRGRWGEEGAGGDNGAHDKDCFRTLSWKPVRPVLEGDGGEKEAENPHSSEGV